MSLQRALESLQSQLGQETQPGDWMRISQERINQFAQATDDHQWIHVDTEKARQNSPFGTTIAHGYLTLSLIVPLTRQSEAESPKFEGLTMAVNYGLNKVRFPAAVKTGVRIRARSVLKQVAEVSGSLQLTREVTIEIEGGGKPACVAETLTRLYF